MSNSKPWQGSLIREIIAGAIESHPDVVTLLRKAKVAAVKLSQLDAVHWIDAELDGYDCKYDDLPSYRKTHGILKVKNPYHGYVPLFCGNAKTEDLLTRAPMAGGIGSLQNLIAVGNPENQLIFNMSARQRNAIIELFKLEWEPILFLSRSQIEIVLNRVVSLILN